MNGTALGIDLGTSSVKVCLLDERGRIVASTSSQYPTYAPFQQWMEQEPADWLRSTTSAITEIVARFPRQASCIESICLTSAAHIGVLLDRENRPVRKALLWSDQRSIEQVRELLANEDMIYAISANKPSTSWTLPHFLWVKEHEPEVWKQVSRICLSKDYLLHWLAGEWATDPATAVSAMLYDRNNQTWSTRLLEYLDLDAMQLPPIFGACEQVGSLRSERASQLGLRAGIPIVNGSLDSATETYGAGARSVGDVVIRIGTAGGIHKVRGSPMQKRTLLTYPFPIDDLWYSQAGTNAAGAAIGWATGQQGLPHDSNGFVAFDELAAEAPAGCDGLLFHPYLNGERTPYWNAKLRGTFTGLAFMHTRPYLARAVLEGVCFSLKDALLSLLPAEDLPDTIVVVGGGAKDRLLMEILSSVIHTELKLLPGIDSSSGCARIGQLALNDPDSLAMLDTVDATFIEPKMELIDVYEQAFDRYRRVSEALVELYT